MNPTKLINSVVTKIHHGVNMHHETSCNGQPKLRDFLHVTVGSKESTSRPSGLQQRKVESPPRLGLRTILDHLGQSITYVGLPARL